MFPTGNTSSSRRKEKAPVVPLTRLGELEAENADLRRINDQLQDMVDGQTMVNQTLDNDIDSHREALEAKDQDIQRLSGQVDSYRRLIDQVQGFFKAHFSDVGHLLHLESDLVLLAAPKKAERMEQAKRQPEQPISNDRAEELESQKTSNDATEGEFQTVKAKKNPSAQDLGSKASFLAGPLSSPNYFRAIDPEDPLKKQRGSKKQKDLNLRPAEQRYVSPPPDTVKTDAQSRTGLRGPATPFMPPSPAGTSSPLPSGTGAGRFGDRRVSDTLHSKGHAFMSGGNSALKAPTLPLGPLNSPQREDVKPLTTPHQPESVKNYAQMAAEPTPYAWASTSFSWAEKLAPILRAKAQKAAESSRSSENPTLGVDGSSMSRKRSLSQIPSVLDLSQKKPKSNRRESSPSTTPTEAELEALRASLGWNERDGRKSEGWGKWERRSWE